jgi:SAM-dependent methyltransferase
MADMHKSAQVARFPGTDGLERFYAAVEAEWPERNVGNLRFYVDHLFDGVPLHGARMLDVGAGSGVYSFYAAAAGARRVVALEPEAEGSRTRVRERLRALGDRLGHDCVELRGESFQEFDARDERFDVILMHSSINHLDERATTALHVDPEARAVYRDLLAKLARMSEDGARLIVVDCTRRNLFARGPIANPFQPTIEWHKHQAPELWMELLEEVGFGEPRLRWSSLNTLRGPGRLVMGNRFANWFTLGAFCLTMTFHEAAIVRA